MPNAWVPQTHRNKELFSGHYPGTEFTVGIAERLKLEEISSAIVSWSVSFMEIEAEN